MDVYVHRGIGPAEASVICLKETYGKPCSICEQASILKKQQAEAKIEISKAKDFLELIQSERNLLIREDLVRIGTKTTEAMIDKLVSSDTQVIEAKEKLREAEDIYSKLSVAVSVFEHRKSELDNLVKLYCSGYFSTPTASNETRKNVNEQTANAVRKNLNK